MKKNFLSIIVSPARNNQQNTCLQKKFSTFVGTYKNPTENKDLLNKHPGLFQTHTTPGFEHLQENKVN